MLVQNIFFDYHRQTGKSDKALTLVRFGLESLAACLVLKLVVFTEKVTAKWTVEHTTAWIIITTVCYQVSTGVSF